MTMLQASMSVSSEQQYGGWALGRVFGGELGTLIRRRLQRRCKGGARAREGRAGERADLALACSEAWRIGLSDSLHGRASGGRCSEEPTSEVGQSGYLRTGGDAADGLVQRGTCQEREPPPAQGAVGARDQLVRAEHALGNQVRGLLRPFGIRLPSRQGTKKFAAAAHRAVQHDARRISAHAGVECAWKKSHSVHGTLRQARHSCYQKSSWR
jgi:hypothetical protein